MREEVDLLNSGQSMYGWTQDEECTASVCRLWLALLVSDSGFGGLFRAHLKDQRSIKLSGNPEDPHEPQPQRVAVFDCRKAG
ncbi:MAG: hypothetical protein ACP5M4_11090 [Acidobacteriaceae bacterium]